MRRVVITGIGAITPIGNTAGEFWSACLAGHNGIAPLERFDPADYKCKLAAEVKGFNPEDHLSRKEARRTDRYAQFALAAADEALAQSGLTIDEQNEYQVGIIFGSGIGGMQTIQEEIIKLAGKGPRTVSPLFIPMFISNMAPGLMAMRYGAKGANFTITTACASGTHAIGEAFRKVRSGELDACLTGGSEATIVETALAGFGNMTALSSSEDPNRASIPFDLERSGFVCGEGGAILVLEELEHALARGAVILAEVGGYGATTDGYHMTAPEPEGKGISQSMRLALKDAGLEPAAINYINAHGTGTPMNDATESQAIRKVFGDHADSLPVSSTKSMTGHLLGAAGAVEAIVLAMACRDGIIPPTINYRVPDPACDLDYVTEGARQIDCRWALSNSLGFGGQNASLIIGRYEEN